VLLWCYFPGVFFNPYERVEIGRRNMPHWRQKGVIYFVTFRMGGFGATGEVGGMEGRKDAMVEGA
jgi:hypothetical protein